MTDRPGHLWAVIQEWLDSFRYKPPSQNELAPRFGVSKSSLSEYKYGRSTPPPAFLVKVADEIQVPYERVLNAMLEDRGYRGQSLEQVRKELMGNAVHPAPIASVSELPTAAHGDEEHDIETGQDERHDT